MSTPTPARPADLGRAVVVPQPRSPVEPPVTAPVGRPSDEPPVADDEPVGVFGLHAWLVPALGVACVLAVFVGMVLLTWLAGGITPFSR
jgi:hypothetical protein